MAQHGTNWSQQDLPMDETITAFQRLSWEEEELDEPKKVTGSVVEFAFGPRDNSYIATSYPWRAQYAEPQDVRHIATCNLPREVWNKIRLLQPRYIMNIAFRRESPMRASHEQGLPMPPTWVIYCYRRGRYGYDTKWQPRKPTVNEGGIGQFLASWKDDESDQVSFCSFGDHPEVWFMRSTSGTSEWHPMPGAETPVDFRNWFVRFSTQTEEKRPKGGKPRQVSTVRAATFGPWPSWVLYTKTKFEWSRSARLPDVLIEKLNLGHANNWTINKAVLNPHNEREFVLVYNHGAVFCAFHSEFEAPFKQIIEEWAESMKKYSREWDAGQNVDFHWYSPKDLTFRRPPSSSGDPGSPVSHYRAPSMHSPYGGQLNMLPEGFHINTQQLRPDHSEVIDDAGSSSVHPSCQRAGRTGTDDSKSYRSTVQRFSQSSSVDRPTPSLLGAHLHLSQPHQDLSQPPHHPVEASSLPQQVDNARLQDQERAEAWLERV